MSNIALDCNIELAGVDTSMPRLETGDHAMVIKSVEVKPNKAETGKNLVVTFATTGNAISTKGEPVNPGFPVTRYFALQQSDNPKAPNYLRDICKLIDAALGTTQENRPNLNGETLASLVGKEVLCKIKVRAADGDFDESNDIADIKPLAQ